MLTFNINLMKTIFVSVRLNVETLPWSPHFKSTMKERSRTQDKRDIDEKR